MFTKKMEHKTGASCSASCGCTFTYGGPSLVDGKIVRRGDGKVILDVFHKKCAGCRGGNHE